MLASYLYSDTTLGPAKVLVDLNWYFPVVHCKSACFFIHGDKYTDLLITVEPLITNSGSWYKY